LLFAGTALGQVTFTPATSLPTTFPGLSVSLGNRVIAIVDLDLDGDYDMVCGRDNVCATVGCGLWLPDQPGGLQFAANLGDNTFAPGVLIAPLTWTGHDVATADLNADGAPDLVTFGRQNGIGGAGGLVCAVLNDGTGGLGAPVLTSVPPWAAYLRTGDFNGDGNMDAAVIGTVGVQSHVQVLLGDGAGGFVTGPLRMLGTIAIDGIVADLDLDGTDDLVFVTGLGVTVLPMTSTGSGPVVHCPVPAPATPHTLTVGQFNADAAPDIATATSFLGTNVLSLFANDGAGTLVATVSAVLPADLTDLQTIASFDVDADGIDEIAAGYEATSGPKGTVLKNFGFGFSPLHPGMPVGAQPDIAILPDAAGSLPHLVTANRGAQTLSILNNNTARVDLLGTPTLGTNLPLRFHSPGLPNLEYFAALSTAPTPGIPLPDGRIVPLALSPLLVAYLAQPHPAFLNFTGFLDGAGSAIGQIVIPNDPAIIGMELFLAFLVLDTASTSGIHRISVSTRVAL